MRATEFVFHLLYFGMWFIVGLAFLSIVAPEIVVKCIASLRLPFTKVTIDDKDT